MGGVMENDKGQLSACWEDKEVHGQTATWAAFGPKLEETGAALLGHLRKSMW